MGLIESRFAERRGQGRTTLVMYLAVCDPDEGTTLRLLHDLVAAGVDLIELAYPFSDPILDGPVIQRANRRALEAGGDIATALRVVRRFRDSDPATPIVLMGYYHPIVAFGTERFVEAAAEAGVDGLIVADLPLAHAREDLLPLLGDDYRMRLIPLSAPMLAAADVVDASSGLGGFLYCVAASGPTGGAAPSVSAVKTEVAKCRAMGDLPVAVGFGIKTPGDAVAIAAYADGVVVATALVDLIAEWVEDGLTEAALSTRVREYVATFRLALDAS